MLRVLATTVLLFCASLPVAAQVPGDACATAQQYIVNGGPETAGVVHLMVCQGGTWKSILSANASAEVTKIGNQTCANGDYFKYDGTKVICTTGGGGSGAIDDLSDAYADYTTLNNLIMGRPGAAALTAGAQHNLFIGELAGATAANSTTDTDGNVAVGWSALRDLENGASNTAVGAGALSQTTQGSSNTAMGWSALGSNTVGYDNTAVGIQSLGLNNGQGNVAVGSRALLYNVANGENTAIGINAMQYANDTSLGAVTYNTAVGAYALQGSPTAANNIGTANNAFGHSALMNNTSGEQNVAVGKMALLSNTTGWQNTVVGHEAMLNNTSGTANVAMGTMALYMNSTGDTSTALGFGALFESTNGNNTALGFNSGYNISTGTDNTAIGIDALEGVTGNKLTGSNNVGLGKQALEAIRGAAANNTALGTQAGDNITTGSGNILIGYGVDPPTASTSNHLNIGNTIYGDLTTDNVGIGTATLTYDLTLDGDTAAQTIAMARETTAATAGRDLTIQAGGARSGGTNLAGGNLILKSGQSTGDGTSNIYFNVTQPWSPGSGSSDATTTDVARFNAAGLDLRYNTSIEWNTKYNNTSSDYYEVGGEAAFQLWQDHTNDLFKIQAAPGGPSGNNITFNDSISINGTGSVAIGSAQTTLAAKFVVASPTAEVVGAAATITANSCGTVKQISATANRTTNTTNTFTAPTASYAGCCMDVVNVDTVDTITLDQNAKFLTGAGTDLALPPGKGVRVCSDGTNWYQAGGVSSASGGSAALSGLTAASGSNSINNGDHAQTWNWQLTTADKDAFTFTENTASTATGHSSILKAATLATSTATPLMVTNLGTANSFIVNDETGDNDTTPFVIQNDGDVGIGTAAPNVRLEVAGTSGEFLRLQPSASGATFLKVRNSSGSDIALLGWEPSTVSGISSGGFLGNGTNGFMRWETGNDPIVVFEPGVNVGFGATAPQSAIHVPDGDYAQFEDNNAGAPPAADCDANTERGRMSIDTTNNRLYICNGATRGWDYVALTD